MNITVTYQIDPGEDGKTWPVGVLHASVRTTAPCDGCDAPSSYRFEPTDPMATEIHFCLDCMVSTPDVIGITIEP